MIQKLIEWMEEEHDRIPINTVQGVTERFIYRKCMDKVKELQATEQCKWAVVKESYLFDSKEQAEDILQAHIQSEIYDYTIVKIIEP
jgi:hypothetical protein